MRFRRSPRRRAHDVEQDTQPAVGRHDWVDSGLAAEVEAFLAGRLVDHLAGTRRPIPTWAALNRLAHAEHHELARLVGGIGLDALASPGHRVHAWAEHERFLAARLLATVGATPEALARAQREVLVPTELGLIDRSARSGLTADAVLDIGMAAVESGCAPGEDRPGDPAGA